MPWRGLLPTGSALPDRVWAGRHRTVLTILWLHVVLLGTIAFLSVDSVAHLLLEAAGVGMIASLAGIRGLGRDVRACLTSAGLIASSMILVHTSDGLAEMHFHFFVMILLISLYQSWKPLVLALVLIFLHHGLGETVLGVHVYDHPPGESWVWALIHGGFVLAQVIAALMFWRLVEAAQESERGAQHALSAAREAVVAAELARAGERGAAIGAELARAGYREAAIAAELTRAGDREAVIAAELTSAAEVQRALLPKLDTQLPGYEISGDCIPSKAVGGDFFDWYPVEGGLGFTLSDVMGKGAAAGIVAATARAVIRSAKEVADPVTALSRADKMLSTELGDGDFFATAFHARLNAIDGRVQYVDAGHGLSILVREDGSWERLHSDDPPLGMGLGVRRSAKEAVLERGDVLVSFSDGVLDLYDGTLRAIDHVALLATSASTADEIVTSLRQVAMRAGNPDDVTVLAIRRVD